MHNLPWTQTEKRHSWQSADFSLRAHAITDEVGRPLDDEDDTGTRLCTFCGRVFESHTKDERHHAYETILEFVQKAPDSAL